MRKLAVFSFSFALGIFLAQYLMPNDWLVPCAVAAFALACTRIFLKGKSGRRILLVGLGLALAFGYDWLYVRQTQSPMEEMAGKEEAVIMTLCDYAAATDYGAKVTVRIKGLPAKAVYYGDESLLDLCPGQTVEDTVSFRSAWHIKDEDVTTFTSKGVFLLAHQKGEAVYGKGSMDSVRWWPARLGKAMREQVKMLFEGDTAAFLTAILTGDKSCLSEQASAALSEAGLYHILAVSGMHCGFLLTLVVLLTGRHRKRLTAAAAIVLLGFYALLTGGSPSVVRACVMLSFLLAAPLFGRQSDGPTSLLTALLLILLSNPFAATSISLQLSFAAMTGILWLTPKLYKMLRGEKEHGKVFSFIASSFSATMGALIFTVPISAYYFGTLVLISPVSNLLCLWAASVVFLGALAAVLASFIWLPLAMLLAWIPRIFAEYILNVSVFLARISYHAVYFTNPYLKYWLGLAYLLFAVAYWMKPKCGRKYITAALTAILTLLVTIRLGSEYNSGDLNGLVLDVGQGQCVVLEAAGEYAVVDCGSRNSWYDPGELAAHHLQTMGCRELDYLILTHYDSDHISGLTGLLARMNVGTLLLPEKADDPAMRAFVLETAEDYAVEVQSLKTRTTLQLGTSEMTIFPPQGDANDNDRSLAVLASCGEEDILITGDMDRAAEKALLNAYELPDIEYLVAGHHGSKTSTSEELLEALEPETVFISVDAGNSYGHPSEETLRRLGEHGCTVYRTDLHGNIYLSLY